jgi:hypothetical protein
MPYAIMILLSNPVMSSTHSLKKRWLAQVSSLRPRTSWVKAWYWSFDILQLCPVSSSSLVLPGGDSPSSAEDTFGFEAVVFKTKDFANLALHNTLHGASGPHPSVKCEVVDVGGRRCL